MNTDKIYNNLLENAVAAFLDSAENSHKDTYHLFNNLGSTEKMITAVNTITAELVEDPFRYTHGSFEELQELLLHVVGREGEVVSDEFLLELDIQTSDTN